MLDPLILKLVSICFALLFLLAAVHKLTALGNFRSTLAAYQLLPDVLLVPLSIAVPVFEALLGGAWLLNLDRVSVAIASTILLAAYTAAIAINVVRGRVHIDCGCGMASSAGRDQTVSWRLVVRNAFLIIAALTATLPAGERSIGPLDYATLVAALLAVVLLYGAANQLISNGAAIGTWRK